MHCCRIDSFIRFRFRFRENNIIYIRVYNIYYNIVASTSWYRVFFLFFFSASHYYRLYAFIDLFVWPPSSPTRFQTVGKVLYYYIEISQIIKIQHSCCLNLIKTLRDGWSLRSEEPIFALSVLLILQCAWTADLL